MRRFVKKEEPKNEHCADFTPPLEGECVGAMGILRSFNCCRRKMCKQYDRNECVVMVPIEEVK